MKKNLPNYLKKAFIIVTVVALNMMLLPPAYAASLTSVSATPSRSKAATASNHQFKFTTPTGVAAGQTMTVTFPSGFVIGSVAYTDIDVLDGATNLTLAAAQSGATWGAAFAGQVLTITSGTGTIVAGHIVTILIGTNATNQTTGVNQITNPSAGTYLVTFGGSFGDTGSVALPIAANDQVALSATIDSSMTFSVSAASSAFGTLSTGSVTTASPAINLTIGTNTATGYTIYVRDEGNGTVGGLYNSAASYNLASGTALLAGGTEGYGVQAASGNATITAPYNVSGNNVGQLQRVAQSLATYGSYTASNHTITVNHLAAISASTRAGSYADTLTYVASGNF